MLKEAQIMNKHDICRDDYMLRGKLKNKGYDWWWHSLTARNAETGEEKPFFIEFFVINPAIGGDKPVFGQTPEKNIPSYLMVKCGWWGEDKAQLHRFFGINEMTVSQGVPFCISAGDCICSETELKGSVKISDSANHPEWMSDDGEMSWNLRVSKKVAFNVGYGTGKLFRDLNSLEMYWHAEGMKTAYEGEIIANDVEYVVTPETSYGYADKNWGSDFTSPWVWLSSNRMTSRLSGEELSDSVFDIGGGRPKAFDIVFNRKLLSNFWYEGRDYEFNLSKFWTFTKTKFDCRETDDEIIWNVRQETLRAIMETEVHCKKKDMLLVCYEAPDGVKRHNRLWNGGNGEGTIKLYEKKHGKVVLIDNIIADHIGCEYGEYC